MEINLSNVCHALAATEIRGGNIAKAEELFNEAKIHINNAETNLMVSRGKGHQLMDLCKKSKEAIQSNANDLRMHQLLKSK